MKLVWLFLYFVTYSLPNQVMFAIVFQKEKKSHENNVACAIGPSVNFLPN